VSDAYFLHCKQFPEFIEIKACASRNVERAIAKASEHGLSKGVSVAELLDDREIDLVLNLTNPVAHSAVNLQILKAGKHCYCEKPFAISYREGFEVLREAQRRKLRVGCAPDTVLGAGIQTCRKLIDEGAIGTPIAAMSNMLNHGSEGWHPNPEFFYQPGGGPLFGAGPYHLTALVTMLGPAKSVVASAKTFSRERIITSQPLVGKKIKVRTPTHLSGVVEFRSGAVATVSMSFEVFSHHCPTLEVFGTKGSIQCTDPNNFSGDVLLWTEGSKAWERVPLTYSAEVGRGLGVADMAVPIHEKRAHRASGEIALHVVEIMEAFHVSARTEKKVPLKSTCRRPASLPSELCLGDNPTSDP
jgi:predicted dehydrogenase